MDLSKSMDYFQPATDRSRIHIIGCGSVGSTIAENLARCGVVNFTLWDFDTVEAHNIVNQMFDDRDIGRPKAEAVRDMIIRINPDAAPTIKIKPNGWNGEIISGYIFLCVDSIDIRRAIVEKVWDNMSVKAVFDVRTSLEFAYHYAAKWNDRAQKQALIDSMQFSHEEAAAEAPVSACGTTLGVVTTVRIISALAVNNYINLIRGKGLWKFVHANGFNGAIDAF